MSEAERASTHAKCGTPNVKLRAAIGHVQSVSSKCVYSRAIVCAEMHKSSESEQSTMQAFNTRGGCPPRRNPSLVPFIGIPAFRLLGPTAFGRRSAENIRLFMPQIFSDKAISSIYLLTKGLRAKYLFSIFHQNQLFSFFCRLFFRCAKHALPETLGLN